MKNATEVLQEICDKLFSAYWPEAPKELRKAVPHALLEIAKKNMKHPDDGAFVVVLRGKIGREDELAHVAEFYSRTCALDFAKIRNEENDEDGYFDVMDAELFDAFCAPPKDPPS